MKIDEYVEVMTPYKIGDTIINSEGEHGIIKLCPICKTGFISLDSKPYCCKEPIE